MSGMTPAARLSLALAGLSITVLCAAQAVGLFPDPRTAALRERLNTATPIAIAVTQSVSRGDVADVQELLDAVVQRNPELLSCAVVPVDRGTTISAGPHGDRWISDEAGLLAESVSQVRVPIASGGNEWGQLQLRFEPVSSPILGLRIPPLVRSFVFVAAAGFLVHFLFLNKMLAYMAPSQAVPKRVRNTLDVLAEGLVVLDEEGRVVLANRAFTDLIGTDSETLNGKPLARLPWIRDDAAGEQPGLPWERALDSQKAVLGNTLQLPDRRADDGGPAAGQAMTFLVNATPLESDERTGRGVIASFDDITPLETKKRQLAEMLQTVRDSTDEIRRQNAELERLATHDPLTGCVNRRRLFQMFEAEWKSADRHGHPLACLMVDVDHFKDVNDRLGHSAGDTVLQRVAEALRTTARESDLVSRYGGEEFCVLLPHTDLTAAERAGERFREAIAELEMPGATITASVGVSERSLEADGPQTLIDQADKALYVAKSAGRNRVMRFDRAPTQAGESAGPSRSAGVDTLGDGGTQNIPFNAVTALISALAYRDQETAAHCRRVADLAVATAEGLIGVTDCYTLEIAALLHDLGKIGVPDQILLKPGELTEQEWDVMRRHDRIGVEIVRASFAYEPLTRIVSQYRADFSDAVEQSVGARILKIADAYDAMTTNRPYRDGRSAEEAFAELRRCGERQFDPELVERFISSVQQGAGTSAGVDVAKETALSIGLQIEHLATALDDQDLDRLGALATRLQQVAERYGVDIIADRAGGLANAVRQDDQDLLSVLQSATDLLRLCRSTQQSYILNAGKA